MHALPTNGDVEMRDSSWGGIPGVACTSTGTAVPTLFGSGDDPEALSWGALGDNID